MPKSPPSRLVIPEILIQPYEMRQHLQAIPRYAHGVQHAARAATYVPILANLYRKHELPGANELTAKDIELIQIAALYHDAGRQSDGPDKIEWEIKSAKLCYQHLIETGVSQEKAIMVAETIVNKDSEKTHFKLIGNEGRLEWKEVRGEFPDTIYRQLLHDADCLDIKRARIVFDAEYLYFYQAKAKKDHDAEIDMGYLVAEARSLIFYQGDDYTYPNIAKKMLYQDRETCFDLLLEDIATHPFLHAMYNGGRLFAKEALAKMQYYPAYVPTTGYTVENILAAMRELKLFTRAIYLPTQIHTKTTKKGETLSKSSAEIEIQKTTRRPDDTKSKTKHGNSNRSVSMGSVPFTNSGFLILDLPSKQMKSINPIDVDTGWRKNKQKVKSTYAELSDLRQQIRKGGKVRYFDSDLAYHNEIVCEYLDTIEAIYCTQDPVYADCFHSDKPPHRFASQLQAVYLQKETEQILSKRLPVFSISFIHQTVEEISFTDDDLVEMWAEMVTDFLADCNQALKDCITVQEAKVLSMYGIGACLKPALEPADLNYSQELKKKIDDKILHILLKNRSREEATARPALRACDIIFGEKPSILGKQTQINLLLKKHHKGFLVDDNGKNIMLLPPIKKDNHTIDSDLIIHKIKAWEVDLRKGNLGKINIEPAEALFKISFFAHSRNQDRTLYSIAKTLIASNKFTNPSDILPILSACLNNENKPFIEFLAKIYSTGNLPPTRITDMLYLYFQVHQTQENPFPKHYSVDRKTIKTMEKLLLQQQKPSPPLVLNR